MKKRTTPAALLAVFCAAALLTGCGSQNKLSYAASEVRENTKSSASQAAYGAAAYDYEMPDEASYEYEADAEEMKEAGSAPSEAGSEEGKTQEAARTEEKLVYTSYMTIQTLTFKESYDYISARIAEFGGIIQNESTYDNNNRWYYDEAKSYGTLTADITVRIPSKNYKDFISSMEGAGGKITNQSQSVENITKRYNDQSILIESLKTQEDRLMEMMEKAESVEDMIIIEERLSEVQTQLNQARNVLSGMDTDVALSTVHLTLQEVVRYESRTVQTTFGDRLRNTISDSWKNFLDFLEDLLFFLIYIFPLALFVLVIALVVLGIRRLYLKAHPERAAEAARRKAERRAAREAVKEAKRRKKENPKAHSTYNPPEAGFTVKDEGREEKKTTGTVK